MVREGGGGGDDDDDDDFLSFKTVTVKAKIKYIS